MGGDDLRLILVMSSDEQRQPGAFSDLDLPVSLIFPLLDGLLFPDFAVDTSSAFVIGTVKLATFQATSTVPPVFAILIHDPGGSPTT